MTAKFEGGKNIAMKVPPHQYDETVAFYRDILGLDEIAASSASSVGFKFGTNKLWVDKVATISQAELWLQVVTDNTSAAAEVLSEAGVARCDEIEDLGKDFDGFWISSPSAIIHLIDAKDGSQE